VLDDSISSAANKPGDVIRMHLKNDLVVGDRVVARAGTPATLRIVDTSSAKISDVYGFVDIFVDPLRLNDGRDVPLFLASSRLSPRDTAGHESTVAIEDTLEDIVIPYAALYQIFRKGKNFVLHPGAELKARLDATLVGSEGGVEIETPSPLSASLDPPHPTFPVLPLAEPMPSAPPPPTVAPPPTTTPAESPPASPAPSITPKR
jgi:hypothetical protein